MADGETGPAVAFYVLPGASAEARLQFACRITDKAYRSGQNVLIWHSDREELARLDELLWVSGDDRSFIPHELVAGRETCEAPVLLTHAALPPERIDVLINLAEAVPQCASRAARIVEIVDADQARRQAGRERFRAYRELGVTPATHHIASE